MQDSCLGEKEGARREGWRVFKARPQLHAVLQAHSCDGRTPVTARDPGQAPSVLSDSPGIPPELLMGLVHGVPAEPG